MERDNTYLRELSSVRFEEQLVPDDFRDFAKQLLLPRIQLTGYKVEAKQTMAIFCLHQLVECGLVGKTVADTRDTNKPGVRLRADVWEAIVKAGFARACVGSESSGKTTRYYHAGDLLELKQIWELRFLTDTRLTRNSQCESGGMPVPLALVVLHSGKVDLTTGVLLPEDYRKRPIPFIDEVRRLAQPGADGEPDPRAIENGMAHWRNIEDMLERINEQALSHGWIAYAIDPIDGKRRAFQPNPCLRQLHVGKFDRAARLYGWSQWAVQVLPRHVREGIKIDGEAVAELDFSCMATRMLYHERKLDPPGDLYRPELIFPAVYGFQNLEPRRRELIRNFVKRATNICWNVRSRDAAYGAAWGLLNDFPEDGIIHNAIYGIEQTTPQGIIDRIVAAHPDLAGNFFTERGMELMTIDGKIMRYILNEFCKAGRAATGLHDAVMCRASDVAFAEETMADIYHAFMSFEPVIKRAY